MEKKKDIFYFSSSHWDREWYQTFQGFRYRLVKVMDGILDAMENVDDFGVFHLDGQTIVLEDYAEIKPKSAERLAEYIKSGRIKIGPWYAMPDEFNLSGESLIRNLMMGHELSKKWGADSAWKFGYVCDVFGHIAQMPQIFQGFDIGYSYQCRGYHTDSEPYFVWRSPDGSEVLNMRMGNINGYGEFALQVLDKPFGEEPYTLPEIKERIKNYMQFLLTTTELPVYIVNDGLDHEPLHTDTGKYIECIKELVPDSEVHHCDLREAGVLLEKYRAGMEVVEGELNIGGEVEPTLQLITNTISSYYPIKKTNDTCQINLEKIAEPMLAYSAMAGNRMEREYIRLAYKHLIQNHPHDSICGCSIDQVHKDMEYRFAQTNEICNELVDDYIYIHSRPYLNGRDKDTHGILTLFNPLPYEVDKVITVDLNMKSNYPNQFAEPLNGYERVNNFKICDYEGNEIPFQVVDIKRGMVHRIRARYCEGVDVHRVTFMAHMPAGGRCEYRIVPAQRPTRYLRHLNSGVDYMENSKLRVTINPNGTLSIYDKLQGKTYDNQLCLVDDGEIGDGWSHCNQRNDRAVMSAFGGCNVEKIESGCARCVFKITKTFMVPEKMEFLPAGKTRSNTYKEYVAVFEVGLSEDAGYVDVKLTVDNNVCDHRLRLAIPTYTEGDKYFAGQAFYCCQRNVEIDYTKQDWYEPELNEKAMNGIIGKRASDGTGLAFVSAKGLHEGASYNDDYSSLYVTLLRSFRKTVMTNGQVGGQIQGEHEFNFHLVPLSSDITYADLVRQQDVMGVGLISAYAEVDAASATNAPVSNFKLSGDDILLSVIKCAEREDDAYVVRMFNASDKDSVATLTFANKVSEAVETNMNEEALTDNNAKIEGGNVTLKIAPWHVSTVMVKF
ncbi:MAG: hypothetical protein E7414_00175 [Ruminococcaceae bacterium]|nr:hypothetical protein [Oscillospiraceae bacterium]